MNATATILQCAQCSRLFEDRPSGRVMVSPPANLGQLFNAGAIVEITCEWPDCAAVKLKNETRPQFKRRSCAKPMSGSTKHPSRPCRSPLPPERDENHLSPAAAVAGEPPQLAHADEQSRFVAQGDGASDCNKMLAILVKNFYAADEARQSRGEWVSGHDLVYQHQIQNPNSRASQLRGSETLEQHPFIASHRLDVDTKWFAGGWCYSICFIEHSERLKRERDKAEKNQKTF